MNFCSSKCPYDLTIKVPNRHARLHTTAIRRCVDDFCPSWLAGVQSSSRKERLYLHISSPRSSLAMNHHQYHQTQLGMATLKSLQLRACNENPLFPTTLPVPQFHLSFNSKSALLGPRAPPCRIRPLPQGLPKTLSTLCRPNSSHTKQSLLSGPRLGSS